MSSAVAGLQASGVPKGPAPQQQPRRRGPPRAHPVYSPFAPRHKALVAHYSSVSAVLVGRDRQAAQIRAALQGITRLATPRSPRSAVPPAPTRRRAHQALIR